MEKYIVTCCSTIDKSLDYIQKNELNVLNYSFVVDGQEYLDDFGISYPFDKFYNDVKKGAQASTSQINTIKYYEFFEKFLKQGINVLHITMSSGITGSVNNAFMAMNELNEKYEAKVKIIDSLSACSGYGLIIDLALKAYKNGLAFNELYNYIEEIKSRVNTAFYTMDLTQLIRGGRVSKTSGFIASTLNICPILRINEVGKLEVTKKVMGRKKAALEVIKQMEKEALNGHDYDLDICINHSSCLEDALYLKSLIEKRFPKVKNIELNSIGLVIGTHTGQGTVALSYLKA